MNKGPRDKSQKPRNIFLTGASGFVGRYLLPRLIADGHTITAYDLKTQYISEENTSGNMHIMSGDLATGQGLDQVPREELDVVIHLAAAGVKANSRNWSECIAVNIVGTQQLLHAMERISSSAMIIYPRTFYEDHMEAFPLTVRSPYLITTNFYLKQDGR